MAMTMNGEYQLPVRAGNGMGKAQRCRDTEGLHSRLRAARQILGHRIPGGGRDQDRPGEGEVQRQGHAVRSRSAERLQDFRPGRRRRRGLRQGRRDRQARAEGRRHACSPTRSRRRSAASSRSLVSAWSTAPQRSLPTIFSKNLLPRSALPAPSERAINAAVHGFVTLLAARSVANPLTERVAAVQTNSGSKV